MATTIDGTTVILGFVAFCHLLPEDQSSFVLRFSVLVGFVLAYEPLLTSQLCTLGQLLTGIRVRNIKTEGKLSILRAYVRIATILILGWVSFLTIPFTLGRRAVHDLVIGSVVVMEWAADD